LDTVYYTEYTVHFTKIHIQRECTERIMGRQGRQITRYLGITKQQVAAPGLIVMDTRKKTKWSF